MSRRQPSSNRFHYDQDYYDSVGISKTRPTSSTNPLQMLKNMAETDQMTAMMRVAESAFVEIADGADGELHAEDHAMRDGKTRLVERHDVRSQFQNYRKWFFRISSRPNGASRASRG